MSDAPEALSSETDIIARAFAAMSDDPAASSVVQRLRASWDGARFDESQWWPPLTVVDE